MSESEFGRVETLLVSFQAPSGHFLRSFAMKAKTLVAGILIMLVYLAYIVFATDYSGYTTANYQREGGADWVIGGTSTGYLTIGPYGSLRFSDDSTIHTATVDLTTAEIKTLYSAPKVLVAAPGTHKIIDVLNVNLVHNYDTNVFDNSSNTVYAAWLYSTTYTRATSSITQTLLLATAAADRVATLIPVEESGAATLRENCALYLYGATGDPSSANAAGTLRAIVTYQVHSTGL